MNKFLFLSGALAALLATTLTARAQNSSDVSQSYGGNSATIQQTFGPGAAVGASSGNLSEVTQVRSGGTLGNEAKVEQSISNTILGGPGGNGNVNSSKIDQDGTNNKADVTQTAKGRGDNGNDIDPPPYGSRIDQTGTDNNAKVDQTATARGDNKSRIDQNGTGNSADVTQEANNSPALGLDNESIIDQTGDGNAADVAQTSSGFVNNFSLTTQTGNTNIASTTQN